MLFPAKIAFGPFENNFLDLLRKGKLKISKTHKAESQKFEKWSKKFGPNFTE
jgi:hypothetical protein